MPPSPLLLVAFSAPWVSLLPAPPFVSCLEGPSLSSCFCTHSYWAAGTDRWGLPGQHKLLRKSGKGAGVGRRVTHQREELEGPGELRAQDSLTLSDEDS